MNNSNKQNTKVAHENEDGTFTIEGNPDLKLTKEDFKKLQELQGGKWIVFVNHDSQHEPGTKPVEFNDAR